MKMGRWRTITVAVAVAVAIVGMLLKYGRDKDAAILTLKQSFDRLCTWVDPVYVTIHTLSIALCLPFSDFFEAIASLLFGFFPAFLYILSAKALVASLSFWIVRLMFETSSSTVKWAQGSRYFRLLSRGVERDGWKFVLVARFSPVPFHAVNCALAANRIGFVVDFLIPTVVGFFPMILKNTSLGGLAGSAVGLAFASKKPSIWSCLFPIVGLFSSVIMSRKIKRYSIRFSVAEIFARKDNPFDILKAIFDEDKIFPISDEKYAEQIELQEALMSSSSSTFDMEESSRTLKGKEKETGESSGSFEDFMSFCKICMDMKPTDEMFANDKSCTHAFCTSCISSYISSKLQENISTIECPDPECRGMLDPLFCRAIIPEEVFGRWESALCESLFLGFEKVYCPFRDCSAMMVVDEGDKEVVTSSECPNCKRLFCAQCRVAWHGGMECEEFQGLNEGEREREDLLLMELAKGKRWRRCPRCKFYVEKFDGCPHITCRCGYQFCYKCGSDWNQHHTCRPR